MKEKLPVGKQTERLFFGGILYEQSVLLLTKKQRQIIPISYFEELKEIARNLSSTRADKRGTMEKQSKPTSRKKYNHIY